ncbi:activator of Hsp90 ATPase [Glomus cerebriforme]|uniref:Activator of Hsp90 ATPase n=1 Tax=Glomus cerebriforme TaxID=658196 RepID=A0A397TGB1_9GLOM|nr:activator of Hsp90 ATPase [Glomus cerebriforme]
MSNWKNVNNWTSKNCLNWAKEYLKEQSSNLTAEDNGINVQTDDLTECSGDAELNQRKGKLIPIIDLMLELTWSGNAPDGTEANGTIKIPELEAGSEDDFEFEITVEDEVDSKKPIKEVVRTHLIPLLKEQFKNFGKDMVETHSKDVKIESSQLGPATPPRAVTPIEPAQINAASTPPRSVTPTASSPDVGKPTSQKIINTTNISEVIELQTSADQVYETLLDPGRVAAWTRSRPDIFRHIGSVFSLFDGNVTGTILELVQNEKIVQTWRLRSWPEGHFSTVTIKFEQASDYTRVHITQEGVPIGEVDAVRNNWQSYYWNPIKSVFGYGSISSSSVKSKNKSSKPRKNKRGSGEKNRDSSGGGVGSSVFAVAIVLTAIVLGTVFLSRSSTT